MLGLDGKDYLHVGGELLKTEMRISRREGWIDSLGGGRDDIQDKGCGVKAERWP